MKDWVLHIIRPQSFFCILLLCCLSGKAQDSVRVESLLRAAPKTSSGALMLHFARQFLDVPYVAHTLEQAPAEDTLVVNLRQMDCTTLVETCVALTLTSCQGNTRYADYCANLNRIRYIRGNRDGYASRNHYFHQWIRSNEAMGVVQEIYTDQAPFIAQQTLHLNFMTTHPALYPQLADSVELERVRQRELECDGRKVRYIPKSQLNERQSGSLGVIHDGDILAIVTRKKGLDTSHLGIAVWGNDGKLHLLNASQIHKRVVLEPMTLYQYMQRHSSQMGIRVIRVI